MKPFKSLKAPLCKVVEAFGLCGSVLCVKRLVWRFSGWWTDRRGFCIIFIISFKTYWLVEIKFRSGSCVVVADIGTVALNLCKDKKNKTKKTQYDKNICMHTHTHIQECMMLNDDVEICYEINQWYKKNSTRCVKMLFLFMSKAKVNIFLKQRQHWNRNQCETKPPVEWKCIQLLESSHSGLSPSLFHLVQWVLQLTPLV